VVLVVLQELQIQEQQELEELQIQEQQELEELQIQEQQELEMAVAMAVVADSLRELAVPVAIQEDNQVG
jgi:hypothetical protein